MKAPMTPLAKIDGYKGHYMRGQAINTSSGKRITFDELILALGSKDIIFIGEVHDNPEHHLIQAQVLQAMMTRYGPVDIAAEAFQHNRQAVIDRYLNDKISEDAFLKEVDWKKEWGFDYSFYRPWLLAAREAGSRLYGINAPREIVKKVSRSGLESLSADERGQIAEEIDLGDKRHRDHIMKAYEAHTHRDLKSFDYFYQAQCVWEDTMAQNIARNMKTGRKIVVFTGNGHIIYKFGIPDRTLKRTSAAVATLMLYPLEKSVTIERNAADFLWLTGNCTERRLPMR